MSFFVSSTNVLKKTVFFTTQYATQPLHLPTHNCSRYSTDHLAILSTAQITDHLHQL